MRRQALFMLLHTRVLSLMDPKAITIRVDGTEYSGQYVLNGSMIVVSSAYGRGAVKGMAGFADELFARQELRKLVWRWVRDSKYM